MPRPKVSIGLPVYNGERYLAEAINSLLAQSFSDFEIVISDNASTDATEEICRRYEQRDARVQYFRQETNRGSVWNFNHVVDLASGTYFRWAADDDLCAPTFLQRCVEVLDDRPEVAWCHSQGAKIDEHGERCVTDPDFPDGGGYVHTRQAGLPRQDFDSQRPWKRFQGVLLGTNWCSDCYGLIRASVLRQTGLEAACFGGEKVMIAELSLRGLYHEVPETLFFQRVHPEMSGRLYTSAEQLRSALPGASRRFMSNRLLLLHAYSQAIQRAKLSLVDRAGCYWALTKYLLQLRKWRAVLDNTLHGVGVGQRRNVSAATRRPRTDLMANAKQVGNTK